MHDSQSMKLNVKGDVNLDHYLLCSFSWIQSHELYQSSFCNLEYVSHVCVSQLISKNQSLHSLARDLLKLTLKAVWLCSKIDGVETIQINGLIKALEIWRNICGKLLTLLRFGLWSLGLVRNDSIAQQWQWGKQVSLSKLEKQCR